MPTIAPADIAVGGDGGRGEGGGEGGTDGGVGGGDGTSVTRMVIAGGATMVALAPTRELSPVRKLRLLAKTTTAGAVLVPNWVIDTVQVCAVEVELAVLTRMWLSSMPDEENSPATASRTNCGKSADVVTVWS